MTNESLVANLVKLFDKPSHLWEGLRAISTENVIESEICEYHEAKERSREMLRWTWDNTGRDPCRIRQAAGNKSCWICRFIWRLCAGNMLEADFVKCWTDNYPIFVHTSYSSWEWDLLLDGPGRGDRSEPLWTSGGVHFHDYQHDDQNLKRVRLLSEHIGDDSPRGQFRILPDQRGVDYDLIKSWLHACRTRHKSSFCSKKPHQVIEGGLYLINVHTRSVTLMHDVPEYVALSYVCGKATGKVLDATVTGQLPDDVPQVVEDAFTTVKGIGMEYIWIDLYCIENDDAPRRNVRIQQMDLIYEGASLTICDLSGKSAKSGLTGLSQPMKGRQIVTCNTKDTRYMAISYDPLQELVDECSWSSRAWTLQESALSHRRLCFHPEGYFMLCREAIFQDLLEFRSESNGRTPKLSRHIPGFDLARDLASNSPWNFRRYAEVVGAYNHRRLTYDSDAFNAVTGLFNRISLPENAHFIHGLPSNDFCNALLWYQRPHLGFKTDGSRRREFPSWSWLGWNSHTEYGVSLLPGLQWIDDYTDGQSRHPNSVHSLVVNNRIVYKELVQVVKCATFQPEQNTPSSQTMLVTTEMASFLIKRKQIPLDIDVHLIDSSEEWKLYETPQRPLMQKWPGRSLGNSFSNFTSGVGSVEPGMCDNRSPVYSFQVEDSISYTYLGSNTTRLEFIMLQHWVQNTPVTKLTAPGIESPIARVRDMQLEEVNFGDRVYVMAIRRRKEDGVTERVAVLWLRAEDWVAANPQPVEIRLG